MHLKKQFLPIFTLFPKTDFCINFNWNFLSHLCARKLLITIFIKFRQKSFIIWFQIGSNVFGRGKKMNLKKLIFASTSAAIFSVIYCARQLLFTIFIKFRQKSFKIWFWIGSNFFGRVKKPQSKKQFLLIFILLLNYISATSQLFEEL